MENIAAIAAPYSSAESTGLKKEEDIRENVYMAIVTQQLTNGRRSFQEIVDHGSSQFHLFCSSKQPLTL